METRSRLQEDTSRGGDASERSGEASPPGDARESATPPTQNAPNPQVDEKPREEVIDRNGKQERSRLV